MPRVTAAFRERQTARILLAAEECFVRDGFHAASMDEIIAAAGMSSSTVYRYFPDGKRSLVHAVSARHIGPLLERLTALADADPPPGVEEAFVGALGLLGAPTEGADAGTGSGAGVGSSDGADGADDAGLGSWAVLACNSWGELARDPEMRDMVQDNYADIRDSLVRLCRRWQEDGVISSRLGVRDTVTLAQNTAFGLIIEHLITGRADVRGAARALALLLAPETP